MANTLETARLLEALSASSRAGAAHRAVSASVERTKSFERESLADRKQRLLENERDRKAEITRTQLESSLNIDEQADYFARTKRVQDSEVAFEKLKFDLTKKTVDAQIAYTAVQEQALRQSIIESDRSVLQNQAGVNLDLAQQGGLARINAMQDMLAKERAFKERTEEGLSQPEREYYMYMNTQLTSLTMKPSLDEILRRENPSAAYIMASLDQYKKDRTPKNKQSFRTAISVYGGRISNSLDIAATNLVDIQAKQLANYEMWISNLGLKPDDEVQMRKVTIPPTVYNHIEARNYLIDEQFGFEKDIPGDATLKDYEGDDAIGLTLDERVDTAVSMAAKQEARNVKRHNIVGKGEASPEQYEEAMKLASPGDLGLGTGRSLTALEDFGNKDFSQALRGYKK